MEWDLRHVDDTEAVLDDSGVYVVVHRIETPETHKEYSSVRVSVRADLMSKDSDPITGPVEEAAACIMSFQGSAVAVRKALARYLEVNHGITHPSLEHMAYIGYELHRAESTPQFVQD